MTGFVLAANTMWMRETQVWLKQKITQPLVGLQSVQWQLVFYHLLDTQWFSSAGIVPHFTNAHTCSHLYHSLQFLYMTYPIMTVNIEHNSSVSGYLRTSVFLCLFLCVFILAMSAASLSWSHEVMVNRPPCTEWPEQCVCGDKWMWQEQHILL